MKISQLIKELEEIKAEHGDELPIYSVDSRSGVSDELYGPYVAEYDGVYPDGEISEHPEGTKYLYFSAG